MRHNRCSILDIQGFELLLRCFCGGFCLAHVLIGYLGYAEGAIGLDNLSGSSTAWQLQTSGEKGIDRFNVLADGVT